MNKSILKNTFALFIPNMLNPVISFVLVLVISRYLGVEGLGQYSLVISYTETFAALASMGLGSLIVREAARNPNETHALFVNSILFGTCASLLGLVVMNVTVVTLGYSKDVVHACMVMSFTIALSTATYYAESVFRAIEKAEYVAVTYLAENIARVGACVYLALNGYGIVIIFVAILGSRVFAVGLFSIFYGRVVGIPKWRFRPDIWRLLGREAPVFASIVIFSTIHLTVDQIMLSKLQDIEAVGIYSAANRLLAICKTLPLAFSGALLPFLTREFTRGTPRLQALASRSCKYLFLITFPLVMGTAILADQIILLLYGKGFEAAAPVLRLHIVSLIPFSLAYLFAEVLIATDNQRFALRLNIIAAVLNVVLNLILIPFLAEMGAVLATLITIVVFNQVQYQYVKSQLFRVRFMELVPKALLAVLVMGVVTYLLRGLNIFANVAISAGVYFGLVFALKALASEEIQFLKGLVRRRGSVPE
ncbi:oligosaccharide flippase family protein [Thermodesulfobacteriota bacterium]